MTILKEILLELIENMKGRCRENLAKKETPTLFIFCFMYSMKTTKAQFHGQTEIPKT